MIQRMDDLTWSVKRLREHAWKVSTRARSFRKQASTRVSDEMMSAWLLSLSLITDTASDFARSFRDVKLLKIVSVLLHRKLYRRRES